MNPVSLSVLASVLAVIPKEAPVEPVSHPATVLPVTVLEKENLYSRCAIGGSDGVSIINCFGLVAMAIDVPNDLSEDLREKSLERFAKQFPPKTTTTERIQIFVGDQPFTALKVSGEQGAQGPFDALMAIIPIRAKLTRLLTCAVPKSAPPTALTCMKTLEDIIANGPPPTPPTPPTANEGKPAGKPAPSGYRPAGGGKGASR